MSRHVSASPCWPGAWPCALASVLTVACVQAQDWNGPFTLVPVSAPDMVLEAVLPGTVAGSVVSIGLPTGALNQAWVVTRREQNAYAIRPGTGTDLVLAVAAGGTDNGTLVILETDAGAEAVCYAREGQMLVATRFGIQICADDGPTQVILPPPDRSRVLGVCLGGAEGNTLFAFCGGTVWKRTVKLHAMGAFTPWAEVRGAPL